jgi:hypothetical protein
MEILGANDLSLQSLYLTCITARVSENIEGSLDPILRAMHNGHHQPTTFHLSGGGSWSHRSVNGPSLVTTEALSLNLTSTAAFTDVRSRILGLPNLGLGDDHCEIIATKL